MKSPTKIFRNTRMIATGFVTRNDVYEKNESSGKRVANLVASTANNVKIIPASNIDTQPSLNRVTLATSLGRERIETPMIIEGRAIINSFSLMFSSLYL